MAENAAENAGAARIRLDGIRRALAATVDPAGRGRIRVRLADALVACGELGVAAAELKQAAAETPPSVALLFGVRALAARLPPTQSRMFLEDVSGDSPNGGLRRFAMPHAPWQVSAPMPVEATHDDTQPIAISLPLPAPMVVAPAPEPALPSPDLLEQAFAALADGKPVRARRLGEEVARAEATAGDRAARLHLLVEGIDRAGARRQALFLSRTLAERTAEGQGTPRAGEGLSGLVARALEADDVELALRWGADLGRPLAQVSRAEPRAFVDPEDTFEKRFRTAQGVMALAQAGQGQAAAVELLLPLMSGSPGGVAALDLAWRLAARMGPDAPVHRLELIRIAFEQELTRDGRRRLARRWLRALEEDETAPLEPATLTSLERAMAELPADESLMMRARRVELLRARGRDDDLIRVLEQDAEIAAGPARATLLSQQADRVDQLGQADRALEIRLGALEHAPGMLSLLVPARRRLEALGQTQRSLELALVALPYVTERAARVALLRDIATLAESTADDRARAAAAWLEILTLDPDDHDALEAAERLLAGLGDEARLGELLAWSVARTVDPAARLSALWRLAEHRRAAGRLAPALGHYREIIEVRGWAKEDAGFGDGWLRRDDRLALETARVLAAPDAPGRARALAERALLLVEGGRLDEAERDLTAALDLGPGISEVIHGLETLHERRGDWRGLRQRLQGRVAGAEGSTAAKIWFGIGRASERLADGPSAEFAYTQARAADDTDRAPLTALRRLAAARDDWPAVAALLEKEIGRVRVSGERAELLVELGTMLAERLDRPNRAVEVLEAALAFQPANPEALEAMFRASLVAGSWEKAAQALEAQLAAGPVADAPERYHRIGDAAERGGKVDRALGFYSRSYARNPSYRPTLERLSEICFDRQQWDNTWKATEHLLDRHGADLEPGYRAELALRSALADLHIAQRFAATARVAAMPGIPVAGAGLRDVAESWASMRFDPRLLAGVDDDRRGRVLSRLQEVLSLTEHDARHPAREVARQTWAALAMVDRRFADAVETLDALAADEAIDPRRRALFAVAAGDILFHEQGDVAGAALHFGRARALNPSESRLVRAGTLQIADESADGTPL